MVDSNIVLYGQTLAYTFYCIVMILLVGWFGWRVTKEGKSEVVKPVYFYSFVAFLAILGVSLHIITYNTIPWVETDLSRSDIQPDKTFNIEIADHQYLLPAEKLEIECNEMVLFKLTSRDLTYGFGIFREDNSMVFQMQVVPGHSNDILWQFTEEGLFTIRSTEYSGPKGINMVVKNAVEVRCSN